MELKPKRQWTPEEQARIDRRRNDPEWELATEEEMATISEKDEDALRRDIEPDYD